MQIDRSRSFAAAGLIAVGLSLSSCADKGNVLCPTAAGLVDASSLTRFAPGTSIKDPAFALFRVDLVSVSSQCSLEKDHRTIESQVTLHFRATRSPKPAGAEYTVPYFVAISSGADIQAKEIFKVKFHFEPGSGTANFSDIVDSAVIHVAPDKEGFDYQLTAGLQITQAELDYNRAAGLYGQ